MLDEIGRSREADFLSGEERDQDASPIRDAGEGAAQLLADHHRPDYSRSVVVGAVVDRADVRPHRVLSAEAQVVIVSADHDVLIFERAAAGDYTGEILCFLEDRAQRDGTGDPDSGGRNRARLEVAIHVLLESLQIDAGSREPSLRQRGLHLDDRNAGGTFRPVVDQSRDLVLVLVLNRSGDEDDRGGPALARLEHLVAQRGPAARLLAVEPRCAIPFLWLVAEHEGDLSLEIGPLKLVVAERLSADSVAQECDLAGEGPGVGESQGHPRGIGRPVEAVPGDREDARLDVERLAIALPERRLHPASPELTLDPIRGAVDPSGAEPAPLHAVGRERIHPGPELLRESRRGRRGVCGRGESAGSGERERRDQSQRERSKARAEIRGHARIVPPPLACGKHRGRSARLRPLTGMPLLVPAHNGDLR